MDEIGNDNCGPLFLPIRANSSGKRGRKRPKPRFASVTAAIPSVQLLPSINKGRGRLFHIRDSPKSTGSGTKQIVLIFTGNQSLVDSITNEYYKTRRCTTVRNSDDQAIPLRWVSTPICILSASAASEHQQHHWISSISTTVSSTASAHQQH